MKKYIFALLVLPLASFAQNLEQDSVRLLDEVTVKAFAYNAKIDQAPISVGIVHAEQLNRFSNTSILPAVNTIPGVRMEERSPGSYRFAIRGSSLRSPFGVRNVKFYWRGLPLTDGGGNTYLNLLDFNSIGSMEIIKGPGGSLYGAGTGGVVLLESPAAKQNQVEVTMLGGSFGLGRVQAAVTSLTNKSTLSARIGYQQADGYREQTKMNRLNTMLTWDYRINSKSTLNVVLLQGNLFYETPGGLTLAQYEENPKQARPATATQAGAVDQQAAVTNQTSYLGIIYTNDWNKRWATSVGVNGSLTDFKNPTIRNYETRFEKNAALRTETSYHFGLGKGEGKLTFGAEAQQFQSDLTVQGNNGGQMTAPVFSDEVLTSSQQLIFFQTDFELPSQLFLTVGGSLNFLKFSDESTVTGTLLDRRFGSELSPRMALLKKVSPSFSVFANVSRGFSPPTIAEALPSAGTFNENLNAERGINSEAGVRGKVIRSLSVDLVAYNFQLKDAIVIQRASDGSEYFVNAGTTSQQGIESTVDWHPVLSVEKIKDIKLWASYSLNNYFFGDYIQDGNDYSSNELTGVAPQVFAAGFDFLLQRGLYLNATALYTDALPLNDANTAYASAYWLLGTRLGYKKTAGKLPFEVFAGADNLLDEKYSLGNDLNALGGRFYNAAAPRNYYLGLNLRLLGKK